MDLQAPIHLGGQYDLTAVSVGRHPDDATVRDCPGCGGYVFDDEWHLRATVRAGRRRDREAYVYCSDECLREWLRAFPAT
ncbi:MAG: hypothetical protein V5A44_11550 [Haloarculaceae archaeon]